MPEPTQHAPTCGEHQADDGGLYGNDPVATILNASLDPLALLRVLIQDTREHGKRAWRYMPKERFEWQRAMVRCGRLMRMHGITPKALAASGVLSERGAERWMRYEHIVSNMRYCHCVTPDLLRRWFVELDLDTFICVGEAVIGSSVKPGCTLSREELWRRAASEPWTRDWLPASCPRKPR